MSMHRLNLDGKKVVVIGGAGLIGSHTVDLLTQTAVREVIVYDNFVRGTTDNLTAALKDPRVKMFEAGPVQRTNESYGPGWTGCVPRAFVPEIL